MLPERAAFRRWSVAKISKTVSQTVTAEASCSSCSYFQALPGAIKGRGIRRAHPPAPTWPEVESSDWCAEFDPQAGWS